MPTHDSLPPQSDCNFTVLLFNTTTIWDSGAQLTCPTHRTVSMNMCVACCACLGVVCAGVYVMPSPRDLRLWHGVIFVRKAMYR